jgi:hypothetical protein
VLAQWGDELTDEKLVSLVRRVDEIGHSSPPKLKSKVGALVQAG